MGRGAVNQKGPQMAFLAAIKAIQGGKADRGILICGSGVGVDSSAHWLLTGLGRGLEASALSG